MKCEQCQNEFESQHGNSSLCSDECKQKRKNEQGKEYRLRENPITMQKCCYCGGKMNVERFFMCDRQKFCNSECKTEYHKEQKRLRNEQKHLKNKLNCKHCKKDFTVRTRLDESYCSNKCKLDFHKEQQRLITEDIRKNTLLSCPICDKTFVPEKTLRQKYCSARCRNLFPKKIYKALQTCLKYTGEDKLDHSKELLGYSPKELIESVQSHPNWNNVKDKNWHLDHIFPIIAFIEAGIKDFKVICALDNLQPLSEKNNCSKNGRYDKDKFHTYLEDKGIKWHDLS